MCKMLFIGTILEIEQIPFDKNQPIFHVEKLNDEFHSVIDKFENPNIYFVGTNRGCSCDFGIEKYLKPNQNQEVFQKYSTQTAQLIDLIESNCNEGRLVELYCCWAGDYNSNFEISRNINLNDINLGSNFDIEEREYLRVEKR